MSRIHNDPLSADKARDVLVKSKLPVDKLSQIWCVLITGRLIFRKSDSRSGHLRIARVVVRLMPQTLLLLCISSKLQCQVS